VPYLPHTNPDHDEDLVARLAADDLPADEREGRIARAWVVECPACAELVADLLAIASATAALPPPRRTRDFRLTEADAARLRPAGWRGLVGRFGSPTFAFTRPLAAGMATLGIAGLLLATIPSGLGGASTAAPDRVSSPGGNGLGVQDSSGEYATGAPAAPPSAAAAPGVLAPGASAAPASGAPPSAAASADGRDTGSGSPLPASGSGGGSVTSGGGSKASASPAGVVATVNPAAEVPPGQGSALQDANGAGPSPLVLLSLVLLVGGLALGALRIVAGRIA
jgi:hypothetical protein